MKSEVSELHVLPTYCEGTFPPEHQGQTNITVVGLNNGGCLKIYLNDMEQAEKLAQLIVALPDLLSTCSKAKEAFETLKKWGKVPMQVVMLEYGIQELQAALTKATGQPT